MSDLFTKIYCNEIKLHGNIKPENVRVMYGEGRKICIIDSNDIPEHYYDRAFFTITLGLPKTIYEDALVRFAYYFIDAVVYPYAINMTREDMMLEKVRSILDRNHFVSRDIKNESSLIARLEYKDGSYYMNYYINNNVINFTRENKRHHKQQLLVNLLIKQRGIDMIKESGVYLRDIIEGSYKEKYDIVDYDSDILKRGIELYNYQREDVEWMSGIEKMVDDNKNTINYDYLPIYPVLDGEFYIYNENIIPSCVIAEVVKNTKSFSFKGGNIISEVGIGKTLIALYAIIKNGYKNRERYDYFVEFTNDCNYFYKRGKMMGNGCKKSKLDGSLYCKEHCNTIFIDKRSCVLKNLSSFNADDFITVINGRKYINTNSTLICCPNQLCDQWVQEYYSKFKSNHRILLIVTQDQYKNVTLADILFSDIIIVSYNFLNNKSYNQQIVKKRGLLNSFLDNKFKSENTDDSKMELLNSKIFNTFDLFYWNRVMLDEAHEIESMKVGSLKSILYSFESRYKWNITGTPFPNKLHSFINLMTYNTDYVDSGVSYALLNKTTDMINIGLSGDVIEKCKKLFRRNTKLSIKDEYSGNIIKEYIKQLEFTSQERSIYDSYLQGSRTKYSDFLIKLCCHPELNNDTKEMIKNCKTLNEIHVCMLDYNDNLMQKTDANMNHIKILIKQQEDELDRKMDSIIDINNISDTDNNELREIKGNLQNVKKRYTLSKQKYDNLSRTYNYLKNSLNTLEEGDKMTCPICLDDIEDDNIAITKCGHKFCWDCIYETHRANSSTNSVDIKCPSCNTVMTNKDIYLLKENSNKNVGEVCELSKIIQDVKSTKIGNIIHFLRTTIKSSDKVILFSQWDELLHKVGDILLKYNINLVYCNGTVYNRKKAISSFCKNDQVNLILLSSRNAASGINLTIANKIIFLEPIYGSRDYRIDVESQGIGRADRLGQKNPIDIYRFIIKDTIEQDILNNFVDDTKLKQLSLN